MGGPKCTMYLQRRTDVSDGMGGYTTAWYEVSKLSGTFTTVDKWEKFLSDAVRTKATHYFMTKYNPSLNITEADRLRHGSDVYEIVLVDDVSRKNRFWEISLKRFE